MGANDLSQTLHLEAAFADFEVASAKLATFYGNLESQVSDLTQELNSARAAELQQLREKEILAARLSSLLDALPAGVVVLDGTGCIAEFNPAAADLLGAISSGDRWVDVVTRTFAPQWDDGHDISLSDGRRVNIATEPLSGEPGQILLIKDVTETRRLQELVNHHRRLSAKTELAAALAHQIRTPLAAAMLHMSNLNSRLARDETASSVAGRALDSMRELERLIEDMLTFARGAPLEVDEFKLNGLLERLAANVKANTPSSEFSFELGDEIPAVNLLGNFDALLSMLLNLVNNARHATNGTGAVCVTVGTRASLVLIVIEDNGSGIAPHLAPQIFEPFFTTSSSGTGLGLAVARSIARAHSGDLVLDDSYCDGARFILSLPTAESVANKTTGAAATETEHNKLMAAK